MQNLYLNYIYIFFSFFSYPFYHRPALFLFFLLAGVILLIIKKTYRAAASKSVKFSRTKTVYWTSAIYVSTFFLKNLSKKKAAKLIIA